MHRLFLLVLLRKLNPVRKQLVGQSHRERSKSFSFYVLFRRIPKNTWDRVGSGTPSSVKEAGPNSALKESSFSGSHGWLIIWNLSRSFFLDEIVSMFSITRKFVSSRIIRVEPVISLFEELITSDTRQIEQVGELRCHAKVGLHVWYASLSNRIWRVRRVSKQKKQDWLHQAGIRAQSKRGYLISRSYRLPSPRSMAEESELGEADSDETNLRLRKAISRIEWHMKYNMPIFLSTYLLTRGIAQGHQPTMV